MKKRFLKTRISVLLAVLLCGFLPAVSSGQLITIGITGEIYNIQNPNVFGGQINIGDMVTGTYVYNSLTPDSNPSDTSVGDYWHYTAPYGISVHIGNLVFETNPNNVRFLVEIGNNLSGIGDGYLVHSESNICSNGVLVDMITWQINDSTQTILSNDALPTTAPNLADWDMNFGLKIDGPSLNWYLIRADVTSAYIIPEPSTLLLLIFGAAIYRRR